MTFPKPQLGKSTCTLQFWVISFGLEWAYELETLWIKFDRNPTLRSYHQEEEIQRHLVILGWDVGWLGFSFWELAGGLAGFQGAAVASPEGASTSANQQIHFTQPNIQFPLSPRLCQWFCRCLSWLPLLKILTRGKWCVKTYCSKQDVSKIYISFSSERRPSQGKGGSREMCLAI